jgi:hypothetical protein
MSDELTFLLDATEPLRAADHLVNYHRGRGFADYTDAGRRRAVDWLGLASNRCVNLVMAVNLGLDPLDPPEPTAEERAVARVLAHRLVAEGWIDEADLSFVAESVAASGALAELRPLDTNP